MPETLRLFIRYDNHFDGCPTCQREQAATSCPTGAPLRDAWLKAEAEA